MLGLLRTGVKHEDGPFSIRWPRDAVPHEVPRFAEIAEVPYGRWEVVREGSDLVVLAVGTMVLEAVEAAEELSREEGIEATVVNCRFLKPYDRSVLARVLSDHDALLTVEEGTVNNGFGAFITREILDDPGLPVPVRMETHGIPDRFVEHGSRGQLLAEIGLDATGIGERMRRMVSRDVTASRESA